MHLVLVTGGRDWSDYSAVYYELEKKLIDYEAILVVQGGCVTGADLHTREWCTFKEVPCLNWPARWKHWEREGNRRSAGPLRNRQMMAWSSITVASDLMRPNMSVLGFWDGVSTGTKNCLGEALSYPNTDIEVFGPGREVFAEMAKKVGRG